MAEQVTIVDLKGRIGQEVGVSKWFDVPKSAIEIGRASCRERV